MNILLIYGGASCEHDISLLTAHLAKDYFDGKIYCCYFTKQNKCYLLPNGTAPAQHKDATKFPQLTFDFGNGGVLVKGLFGVKKIAVDVAVNCCHGRCGEDGAVASLCALANVPLVGSNVIASALTMDKGHTKAVLRSLKVPVVSGRVLLYGDLANVANKIKGLAYPIIVKPCSLGSSLGVSVCYNLQQLKESLSQAFYYDDRVLCEHLLANCLDLNCSAMVVDGKVVTSKVDVSTTKNAFLTFEDKYVQGNDQIKQVSQIAEEKVRALTAFTYQRLGLSGVVRVDYLQDEQGKLYLNEVNSIPGSLAYNLFKQDMSRKQFGNALVKQAMDIAKHQLTLITSVDTGILSVNGCKGSKS